MVKDLSWDLIEHIRSFCDIDTKSSMFKAGIPMQRVRSCVRYLPIEASLNYCNEWHVVIPIGTDGKKYVVTKGSRTPFLVYMLGGEYEQHMGFWDHVRSRYFFVKTHFGP